MKKILVTGATGFIGFEVSSQLSRQGFRPRLMVRRPIRGMLLKSLDAELMQGDLKRPVSLQRLVRDIDTVIHPGAMATFESYHKVRSSIRKPFPGRAAATAGPNSRRKACWRIWPPMPA